MMKMKIGITGSRGFIGRHLYNTLGLFPEDFEIIEFHRAYFHEDESMEAFVSKCDVIVHLAALNRHDNDDVLYDTNIVLVQKLISALERTGSRPHVIMSSSTQESRENSYGQSKQIGRDLLAEWAQRHVGVFTGLLIPNVFGAFGKPEYNSFISTFCHQLTHGQQPVIQTDGVVDLLYVQDLVNEIISIIRSGLNCSRYQVAHTATEKVSEVLALLEGFADSYLDAGRIPAFENKFALDLFNTFRSYVDYEEVFPKAFQLNTDHRGSFVEIIRTDTGGQSSYSSTVPGITRGNHFHTRKIERFAVISGKALIQLRRVDSDEILNFYLDGATPSYVDMPIWYTHNIKNIGEGDLITMFWINEAYDPTNPDTYLLEV